MKREIKVFYTYTQVFGFLNKLHCLSVELLQWYMPSILIIIFLVCVRVSYLLFIWLIPIQKQSKVAYFNPAEARRGAVHLRPLQKQQCRGMCVCLSRQRHGCKQGSCPKHSFQQLMYTEHHPSTRTVTQKLCYWLYRNSYIYPLQRHIIACPSWLGQKCKDDGSAEGGDDWFYEFMKYEWFKTQICIFNSLYIQV